ncbi:hypothetical protein Pla163_23960 [Planctomycetes bacterium Pla163]|uniref:VOC domain-containing protein n=1 Tax=Rohdeia mirabilis TaxID=2528008 RepID=A0A518D1A1_9BACT|nr:hypothetical protein Pla163_23960 [Planctomycetes bacterium Pla163]
MEPAVHLRAHSYEGAIDTLPTVDLAASATFYARAFGMTVDAARSSQSRMVLVRDQIAMGLETNGRDPEQNGAAIEVDDVERARAERIEGRDAGTALDIGEIAPGEHGGRALRAVFDRAPDGLCFSFHTDA